MILADTSVWVEHFRNGDPPFAVLLEEEEIATHEFIVGELACGNLANRARTLALLGLIQRLPSVGHEDVLAFVETHRLYGRGLGWIDMHLLAAAWHSGAKILTLDRAMQTAAEALRLAASSL
ncbi:MAG: PIN domain-containing protein [Bryobacteraceae bacterium]